ATSPPAAEPDAGAVAPPPSAGRLVEADGAPERSVPSAVTNCRAEAAVGWARRGPSVRSRSDDATREPQPPRRTSAITTGAGQPVGRLLGTVTLAPPYVYRTRTVDVSSRHCKSDRPELRENPAERQWWT